MAYSAEYNAGEGYIAITAHGTIDRSSLDELIAGIIRLSKEHDCRLILTDYRAAELQYSTLELYDAPAAMEAAYAAAGVELFSLRRAMVVADDVDDFEFFEIAARNRSHNVRMFRDYDEAKKWLLVS